MIIITTEKELDKPNSGLLESIANADYVISIKKKSFKVLKDRQASPSRCKDIDITHLNDFLQKMRKDTLTWK